ncbi:hypothetical protein [Microbispora sp. ATCC PTA-5024]|uniref:hypothetical protein n=1 Tax=Microbispora sp. ATCC PTA-5024 TaxID=316330 RepID=UPI0003DCBE3A|nr:hypothetical protein [Microbispora sp. ATCC PTA-5024]ETK34092.1 hypothetical protein MPTA5024_21035 [Microbispora sp. ATCC PTA-5024]
MTAALEAARRVADAVLYEGYLLYPYRASAAKNRVRWQFGVLVPPAYSSTGEPSATLTECLLEAPGDAALDVRLRFLHVTCRRVERAGSRGHRPVPRLEAGGRTYLTYDQTTEREIRFAPRLSELDEAGQTVEVHVAGDRTYEPIVDGDGARVGRVVSVHEPIDAVVRIGAERLPGPYGLVRLRVAVGNTSSWDRPGAPREHALRRSLVAAHLLLAVTHAAFVSLLDPPEWAAAAARLCRNEHTWPVLVGEPGRRDAVLSSPIILYDYPSIAPESPGDLFDATEIDELLTLRALTLTEEEAREARATDPRAAEILDRAAELPPEVLERLHGAIRGLGDVGPPSVPWWDPGADGTVSPDTDSVLVAGRKVARGSRVRLHPGHRRADAHDMFLAGRTALVEGVFLDVDGVRHLAVTLEDDEGADLQRAQGRFLYFAPDEVEPIDEGSRP